MAKVSTSISIDTDVKAKAQELFAELGMDLSTAVNIFLRQAVHNQGIPFDVSFNAVNAETQAAIQEIQEMKAHPERYKRYSNFEEALQEILADA